MNEAITMYGTSWCGYCRRTRTFLERHGVPYLEINIEEDEQAAATVAQLNGGMKTVPTLVFPDGTVMTAPGNQELADKLGIAVARVS